MTTVLMLASAEKLDAPAAMARFEAWAPGNPYAPYGLRHAKNDDKANYHNDRTEAAYRGFTAGLAASGSGTIQAQFEQWALDKTEHAGLALSLELSKYFNFRFYDSDRTQHAYEGFVAAYEQRLLPQDRTYAPIRTFIERMDEVAEIEELREALTAERALTAQLTSQLAAHERLQNPELLYTALHCGLPARLPERWFRHLANCADDTLLSSSN
jgi:hypothetical protein